MGHSVDIQRHNFANDLLRYSFFVEYDGRAALELADRIRFTRNAGFQEQLHARIAEFMTSDAYRAF